MPSYDRSNKEQLHLVDKNGRLLYFNQLHVGLQSVWFLKLEVTSM